MNAARHILFIFVAILGLSTVSCISDDFTDSPDATLSFSTDTVNFGAVFTDLETPTARLLVFNRNKKGVSISSIRFKDPDTPFRMNVDGESGSYFSNVEIRGNDSIYIFLQCYLEADDALQPTKRSDLLEFVTNGVTQTVEVEAWGWNVIRLKGETVTSDMTLTAERPYIIFDTLRVSEGATLSIDPGAWVLFHDKASLLVEGTLNAVGSVDNMIRMSGDRLDDVLQDTPYDLLAGQWDGVTIAPQSFGNRMEYVNMRSTVYGLRIDSCADISRQKLTLVNSWLHNSQGNVLSSEYAKVEAYGCCFSEAAASVVALVGGSHKFVQCTIANAYLFSSYYEPNLLLLHCLPSDLEDNTQPLMTASFENCIIWGDIGDPLYPGDLTGSDVYLKNVLLKANGSDDANFINCLWNEDPLYYTVRSEYLFDYQLQPDSPALHAGNYSFITPECAYDMYGISRLLNGAPALGAYAE